MRWPASAYAKTRTQISCAVTPGQIGAFVFTTWIIKFQFFIKTQNFERPSVFCDYTVRFVSDLAGGPKTGSRTSRIIYTFLVQNSHVRQVKTNKYVNKYAKGSPCTRRPLKRSDSVGSLIISTL